MTRSVQLSSTARWWGSTLFQTSTLELATDGKRLLVDPGVSPWEIAEAAGDHVDYVVLTHGDWDHVLGVGLLETAEIVASRAAAGRLADPKAVDEIVRAAGKYYIPAREAGRLRVDRAVDPPATLELGPWPAVMHAAPGHTDDGISVWLPGEELLVVGDYLSELEIPFVYHSASAYRATLELLSDTISRERPEYVVCGHGRPHKADRALEIAEEDLAYVSRLIDLAEAGGADADAVTFPRRGVGDSANHEANVAHVLAEVGRA
jgi:hydroxyacylglutathione hydrolase